MRDDSPSSAPLHDLAIVSCGSPQLLARAVHAWREHLATHRRTCRIVVADDSRPEQDVQRQRAAALSHGDSHGDSRSAVTFVGIAERRRLARELCRRTAVDPGLVELLLFDPERSGYTLGANLNGVLLATAGRTVLCVDQDVEPIAHRPPGPDRSARLTDERPVEHWWYERDDEALAFRAPCDILAEHEAWLGRPVTRDALEIEAAGAPLQARQGRGGHVVATWMGVIGQPGFADVHTLALEHADAPRTEDPARLAALLQHPRALRCAPCPTLGPGRDFTSAITAYDNRVLLPPFFPIGRGIDLVFGLVAAVCRGDALFAHLSWALAHDRPTASVASGSTRLNLAAALCELVVRVASRLPDGSPADRMIGLGRGLEEVALAPSGAFAMLMRAVDIAVRRARAAQLSARMRERPTACAMWTGQMQARIDALSSAPPAVSVPRELHTAGASASEGLRRFQRWVAGYGRILQTWPTLVAAAIEIPLDAITGAHPCPSTSTPAS